MDCTCRIRYLLDESGTQLIKNLFALVDKKGPQSTIMALLDGSRALKCPFLFSWGYQYYCDNQDRIKRHLEDNRNNDSLGHDDQDGT